jgi:hypothetical protein
VHFLALTWSSHASLAAENLFLRKQLAFYLEREARRGASTLPPESRSSCSRSLSAGGASCSW